MQTNIVRYLVKAYGGEVITSYSAALENAAAFARKTANDSRGYVEIEYCDGTFSEINQSYK